MGLSRGIFGALTVDMRDLGRSIWRPSLTGSSEIYDVVAVCNLVFVSLSATRILLVGLMQVCVVYDTTRSIYLDF